MELYHLDNGSTHYLQMYHNGSVGGYYVGNWVNSSSRERKENINPLSAEDAQKTLEGLNPVTYNYKANNEEAHVGFIAEDVPDLVATKNRKGLSPMDMVAVLTKVIQEQSKDMREQSEKIERLEKELAILKNKLR